MEARLRLDRGEIYGRLTVLRLTRSKQGTKYLCGCECGRREHFRAKALMRADGVRECRKCASPFKTAKTTESL